MAGISILMSISSSISVFLTLFTAGGTEIHMIFLDKKRDGRDHTEIEA